MGYVVIVNEILVCEYVTECNGCQDTSDTGHFGPRHFGTSAELSRHIGTSVEVSYEHFSTRKTIRHRATLDQAMARRTAVLA